MWRLKIAVGGNDGSILSTKNFVGRQIWEFDSDVDDDAEEELAQVEAARLNFYQNRHQIKVGSDLLWRIQVYIFIITLISSGEFKLV